MGQVIVRRGDDAYLVAAREVFLHEPLEGAVHRHHLDQRLQARMGLSEVPRVVGVRYDDYVAAVVTGVEFGTE